MSKIALFPGSFDPFTRGHQVLVEQALEMFDGVVIGVGRNFNKKGLLSDDSKIRLIKDVFANQPRVSVEVYESLTVDFCKQHGIKFLLRGMRNAQDFEFERNIMRVNNLLAPELITVMLFTPPEYEAISSSVVRELMLFGKDVGNFMPQDIDIENYL